MSEAIRSVKQTAVQPKDRRLFFPMIAIVMTFIVLVGFSRTFYFRTFTGVVDPRSGGALPLQIIGHGLVLSLWMLVFLTQSWVVYLQRVPLHRFLGYAGVATAVLVVASGVITNLFFPARALGAGMALLPVTRIYTGNFITLVSFAIFVALAIHWRRRSANHKRLMYIATLSIVGPALATGERPLGNFLVEFFPRPDMVVTLSLIMVLLAYDYLGEGRLRKVSLWAGGAVAAKYAVNIMILAPNDAAQQAVLSLA